MKMSNNKESKTKYYKNIINKDYIIKIADRLDKLYSKNLYYLSPLNIKEEQDKFFKSNIYNPQFKYHKVRADTEKLKKGIKRLYEYKGKYKEIVYRYADKSTAFINMLDNLKHNMDINLNDSITYYGFPTKESVRIAKRILSKKGIWKKKEFMDKKLFISELKRHIKPYGWTLIFERMPSRAKVIIGEKKLVINPDYKFSEKDLKRLIVHEINAHIVRAYNHEKLNFPFKKLLDGTSIEEGIAFYMEEQNKVNSFHQSKIYAARLIGVTIIINHLENCSICSENMEYQIRCLLQ